MKVKMILPAPAEALTTSRRSIKFSRFPPLGLPALAAFLNPDDEVTLQDEHVERLDLDDRPDLVALQVYVTSAFRAYAIADEYRKRGTYVAMGGLHPTSCPEEALRHADSVFQGPGEDTWPAFLRDFHAGRPKPLYRSRVRCLVGVPPARLDLIKRHLYLAPNSIVVSRGCPHHCDFCYKDAFYTGGRSFYTRRVDEALGEIERLPGRHLYFLDDHLFGDRGFAAQLFDGLRGMNRLWQAAATVDSVLAPGLLEKAAACGLASVFVGFESLSAENLRQQKKFQNVVGEYARAIERIHGLGVMINASFVFGMDNDDGSVFDRTVEWAVRQGFATATFHILTPYPGTRLFRRMEREGRLLHRRWDLYDTRHCVFRPARMSPDALEAGRRRAYERFFSWRSLARAAATKPDWAGRARHFAYAAGSKKFGWLWNGLIRTRQVSRALPILEAVLAGGGRDSRIGPIERKGPIRGVGQIPRGQSA